MKLSTFTEAIKKDKSGNQLQRLEVIVDYNFEEDSVEEITEVNLYINNIYKGEISSLLDGAPLESIIAEFDWREVYRTSLIEEFK